MIPKTFTLINRTYDVVALPPHAAQLAQIDGAYNRTKGLIWLDTEDAMPQEGLEHVFFHELAHALLDAVGKDKASSDEELVDLLGALLHQYMQTKKGKFSGSETK